MRLNGKRVTVVGLGNSGMNAAILLLNEGARVWVTDCQSCPQLEHAAGLLRKKGANVEIGVHTEGFVKGSDLVVVSPGVEDSSDAIKYALGSSIPIIGEMELGYRFCRGKIIAVTGTNGKSTVTTLVGEILKDSGIATVVCGNIGNSLCGEIAGITSDTWVVLEVSSFQLERISEFKPKIALILNITGDHMDRYNKFSDYYNEKLKIFSLQGREDRLILNYDAENLRPLKELAASEVLFYSRSVRTNGAFIRDQAIYCAIRGLEEKVCDLSDIRIKGVHNQENVLASCLAGILAGCRTGTIPGTLRSFKGLAHRVETVDIIDGVEYIDDSKGTTVDSTKRALESSDRPVILIAGGKDKHSDYTLVRGAVKDKVRHAVLIGEAKHAIKEALRDIVPVHEAGDMRDAVEIAHGLAKEGYSVLLSPMCSSFDMFKSYKDRGDAFRDAVSGIKNRPSRERP